MIRNLGEKYSPLYFLAALGFGGMAVFFFMAFMHITPHPETPMPTFESITGAYANGDSFMRTAIIVGYVGMIAMLAIHIGLLIWNFREFNQFKHTEAYQTLKSTNAEVTLMAIPLTLGMTINGAFVAALALVPGLWSIIQSLMPLALLAYGSVGVLALVIMTNYLRRIIGGGFSFEANGGLNQLIAAFSMSMVAVGFGAPAAMGTNPLIVMIGVAGSMFFGFISVLLFGVFLVAGVMSIMQYGLALPNSATLWLAVPILTLYSITVLRDRHGMQTLMDAGPAGPQEHAQSSVGILLFLTFMMLAQVAFLGLGYVVMRSNGFFQKFVLSREETSPVAFTLVCPGVGLSVLSMFYINTGLIQNGLIEKFSGTYYAALLVPATIAAATLWLAFTLFRNQLSSASKFAQEQKVLVNA
ncbi:hypothetical protein B842_12590 [Corynebacterium humireducens NBRC 106098 = DSM 45392]|uniref:Uncharacterized protein n=1 Tax=Corynebacterium humireducens NBRC 106098 = DSM 45392 TaxID=1223515 RepID=A0A0B5DDS4_9CORY|nr:hypothetical protein [Corynebacterium humireducens]AJE34363.1 hypothetical protein B842_12590 [Corynebacterium humireducens NBRC 106098 = DSM 45392]